MMVFGLRVALAAAALGCGVRAVGYWVILQVGGVRPAESGGIALVAGSCALAFVLLSCASAWLVERRSGARAVAGKALFLVGAYGIPPIALFIVASQGSILRMPEMTGLLILFVSFLFAFRPRSRTQMRRA